MSNYDQPPFDGMTEAVAMGMVMEPPEGFLARAVARGLAIVEAEEALVAYREQRLPANATSGHATPANDKPATACTSEPEPWDDEDEPVTLRPMPRKRQDSGVFPAPLPPDAEQ